MFEFAADPARSSADKTAQQKMMPKEIMKITLQ
jgi:hypothetical protein